MKVIELTKEQFDEYSKNCQWRNIYQTSTYAEFRKTENNDVYYLGLIDDNNNILAATLVIITIIFGKYKYGLAPYGFLMDYNDKDIVTKFTRGLRSFLGKKNVMAVKLNPLIIKNIYDKNKKVIYQNPNLNEILATLKKLGYYHFGFNNYFESLKPRFEAIIDLDKPLPELFGNLSKEHRNKTRKASNRGLRIYKGDKTYLPVLFNQTVKKYPKDIVFYEHLYDTFDKKKVIECYFAKIDSATFLKQYKALYDKELAFNNELNQKLLNQRGHSSDEDLNKKLASDLLIENYKQMIITATKFLKDNPEGFIMASALTIKYADQVYLYIHGYDEKYKNFSASHLLIWKLIEKYSKEGYKKFNLGGIADINLKDNKFKNLNDFKTGFGTNVYEYIGDLEMVTNNVIYFMYQNAEPFKKIMDKDIHIGRN